MAKKHDYGEALDELERLRASGKISEGKYLAHREALLSEASKPYQSPAARIALGVVFVLILFILIMAFK